MHLVSALFEGDILGIPPDFGRERRLNDDSRLEDIFKHPVCKTKKIVKGENKVGVSQMFRQCFVKRYKPKSYPSDKRQTHNRVLLSTVFSATQLIKSRHLPGKTLAKLPRTVLVGRRPQRQSKNRYSPGFR